MTKFEIAGHKFYVKKTTYHKNDICYLCYNIRHTVILSLNIYIDCSDTIIWYVTTPNNAFKIGKIKHDMKSKTAKTMILDYILNYHCY